MKHSHLSYPLIKDHQPYFYIINFIIIKFNNLIITLPNINIYHLINHDNNIIHIKIIHY